MKKILLFLSLAFFLTAGVVTATKVQNAINIDSELVLTADNSDVSSIVFPDDDDKKKKGTKDAKTCKTSCKEKSCDKGAKKCCDKSAKKCCDKGSAVKTTEKKVDSDKK